MSPKMGRPPSENPKTARLEIRVTPQEKQQIKEFCNTSGLGLLELLKIGIETANKK